MRTGYVLLGMGMKFISNKIGVSFSKTYELNKDYYSRSISPNNYGFEYFESLKECMAMYGNIIDKCRIFECELKSNIFIHINEYANYTNHIRLTREVSQDEIKKYIENNLDVLINDENWSVRLCVAKYGYGLDKLINDEDWVVRAEANRQYDKANTSNINKEPKQYDPELDKLLNSKSVDDRLTAAKHGYGLDKLINDKEWLIRAEVANQGYGLDKLINDEDWVVRAEANRQYDKANTSNINKEPKQYDPELDKLLNSKSVDDRLTAAKHGYGLDKLIGYKEARVRREVANQGYGLDILMNDKDDFVRDEANRQYDKANTSNINKEPKQYDPELDKLLNSKSVDDRLTAAKHGYGLDKLINDKEWLIRAEVANQGYGLDKLINDEDWVVRAEASSRMK